MEQHHQFQELQSHMLEVVGVPHMQAQRLQAVLVEEALEVYIQRVMRQMLLLTPAAEEAAVEMMHHIHLLALVVPVSSFSKCNQHKVDLSLGHSQALVFGNAQQEFLMTK